MRSFVLAVLSVAAILAPTVSAQYVVSPAGSTFAPIANAPGAVMLGAVSNCDDCTQAITLSFPVTWFGGALFSPNIAVSSNGNINLDNSVNNMCCSARPLNQPGLPERISVLQEDLQPSAGGEVWLLDNGTSAIISYENCFFYSSTGNANAQCEIFINGDVELRFGSTVNGSNDVAGGLSRGNGIDWISPQSILPEYDANGLTTGFVIPQNTGCRFLAVPVIPEWELNDAAASTDFDGLQQLNPNATNAPNSSYPIGGPFTFNLSSTNTGVYDVATQLNSAVPASAGGLTTPGGQTVNLNVSQPIIFLSTGGTTTSLPAWAGGSLALTANAPTTLVNVSAQGVWSDPSHWDGAALSQASNFATYIPGTCGVITAGTTVPLGDDDAQVQALGFSFPFYGTSYTEVAVCSNGSLTFGGSDPTWGAETELTSIGFPIIHLWQTDLYPPGSVTSGFAGMSFGTSGSSATINWDEIPPCCSPATAGTNTISLTAILAPGTICVAYTNLSLPAGGGFTFYDGVGVGPGAATPQTAVDISAAGANGAPINAGESVFESAPLDLLGTTLTWLLDGSGNPMIYTAY
ncbi:MAG: hypothetical protein CL878_05410 [Dehalococcoidia bacterium]|nr:hypothetical protein [Dehalococcoidia bacterium]